MIDVEKTIISQYGNSPTIRQLINNMNDYLDPRADFEEFFNYVWNVDTAQGFGLDIWGNIVGVSRSLTLTGNDRPFGFSQATGCYPFNDGVFYQAGQTNTYVLSDDAYRVLILTKALSNISSCSAPALNQLLQNLFPGRGAAYVLDLGSMKMRYVFNFTLLPYEFAIISQGNVLPRPAGVEVEVFQIPEGPIFGFSEAGASASPFNEGVFLPEGSIAYAT